MGRMPSLCPNTFGLRLVGTTRNGMMTTFRGAVLLRFMLFNWFDHPFFEALEHSLRKRDRRRVAVPLRVRRGDEASSSADVSSGDSAPILPALHHEPAERLVTRARAVRADSLVVAHGVTSCPQDDTGLLRAERIDL